MSIFGSTYPQFIVGSNTIALERSIIEVIPKPDIIEHKSVFNDTIIKIPLGNHLQATITLYLGKYNDPVRKFAEINQYKNTVVDEFYQYSDGNPFCIQGTFIPCQFYVSEVTPYCLETPSYYDVCKIKLNSVHYCNAPYATDFPVGTFDTGYGKNYGYQYGIGL